MRPPLIGVTAYQEPGKTEFPLVSLSQSYLRAVRTAGGLPVLLPPGLQPAELEALLPRLDGLLLTGGSDLDPALFGGTPHPEVYEIDPERDLLELTLVRLAAADGKPFLGICRGIQAINVALGGSLYTHIPDQLPGALKHDYYPDYPRDTLAHAVRLQPGTRLAALLGDEPQVNSLHHQGILKPAAPLRAVGWAPDGLIEAVELPGHPFGMGVQWHPEWLQAYAPMRALFRSFIEAASH